MCSQFPDAKTVQINLTGFLESSTPVFMSELWEMLVSAQSNIGGIPSSILEAKKAEILAAKVRIKLRALVVAHPCPVTGKLTLVAPGCEAGGNGAEGGNGGGGTKAEA